MFLGSVSVGWCDVVDVVGVGVVDGDGDVVGVG